MQQAGEAALDAADATTRAGDAAQRAAEIQSLLTPEGFDAERLSALIDESDLPASQKADLQELVSTASEGPAPRDAALEDLREALQ